MFLSALIISLPIALAEEYRIDYDQNGNIIYDQESNVYRDYNELNQLIRTRLNNISGTILQEYTYEPLQERIFIKDEFYSNGTLKSSTYYFGDDYVVIQNSSGIYNETYIYQDGVLVGYEDSDGKKRYVLPDHEGSAHIVLDENGNVFEENLFSPFAEPLQGVKESRFSYEAREYDELVQDYDFRFRKYNPNIRIFMQPDTLIQDVYDPQSLNRYSFERSNPYGKTDPTGHFFFAFNPGTIIISQNKIIIPRMANIHRANINRITGGILRQFFRLGGYQDLAKYPSDSPIHRVTGKWKYGGMARQLESGDWEAIRFDAPHEGMEFPHINYHYFEQGGRVGLREVESISRASVYDHMRFFVQQIYADILQYKSYFSDDADESSSSGGNGQGGGGGGGCRCGPYGDLREEAENNPNDKAEDIIKRWRDKQKK